MYRHTGDVRHGVEYEPETEAGEHRAAACLRRVARRETLIEAGVGVYVDAEQHQHQRLCEGHSSDRVSEGGRRRRRRAYACHAANAVIYLREYHADAHQHEEKEDHIGDGDAHQAAEAGQRDRQNDDNDAEEDLIDAPGRLADEASRRYLSQLRAVHKEEYRGDDRGRLAVGVGDDVGNRYVGTHVDARPDPQREWESDRVRADRPDEPCSHAKDRGVADGAHDADAAVPRGYERTDYKRPGKASVREIIALHVRDRL